MKGDQRNILNVALGILLAVPLLLLGLFRLLQGDREVMNGCAMRFLSINATNFSSETAWMISPRITLTARINSATFSVCRAGERK